MSPKVIQQGFHKTYKEGGQTIHDCVMMTSNQHVSQTAYWGGGGGGLVKENNVTSYTGS